jgi:hypothetical protein
MRRLMMKRMRLRTMVLCVTTLPLTAIALGAVYDLSWFTIDSGGEMWTTGGDFELSGTTGQPDASATVLTGGDFELIGGFWKPAERIPDEPDVTPEPPEPLEEEYEESAAEPLPPP